LARDGLQSLESTLIVGQRAPESMTNKGSPVAMRWIHRLIDTFSTYRCRRVLLADVIAACWTCSSYHELRYSLSIYYVYDHEYYVSTVGTVSGRACLLVGLLDELADT
jgi:hypothetical protein